MNPEMPTAAVVRVFGGTGLDDGGMPVSIGGPRQRRLLALLAIRSGAMVSIDWLAEHLWDDLERPDDTARAIRTYVSRLRSSFPAATRRWIETEPGGYRLGAPPERVEHLRFAMLRADANRARGHDDPLTAQKFLDEALALWRGEPFLELEDLPWAQGDIEHLRSDRLEAMEERWEVSLALGRHTQITGELGAFTAKYGLRERAAHQYALALHRSGRTVDALRVVSKFREELVESSGLDPSPGIIELEAALLNGDPSLDVDKVGRPLRGYRLLEQAGSGAFSIVWRGIQPSVNREVAIKQIRSELASQPDFIRRFEAEAHLVARIEHPHIVPLIDYWRDPDSAYLVMRWLSGGTLELRLDDGPMTIANTVKLAYQIGGALSAAHGHGVVHRDVKSPNILFDEEGNAFLGDFGIALTTAESSGPAAALSQGSPAYASPEQIRREKLDPRADIFSLAVVLFECLTGSLPFRDSQSVEDLVERQLHALYPSVAEWRDDVPVSIVDAVAKATAKNPEDRFGSVEEFLEALESDEDVEHSRTTSLRRSESELTNPYKGLLAFDDGDTDRFFGRESLVNELVERFSAMTVQSRCVVVVGPSGSGKSSVVRAGLVPALRHGAATGSDNWFVTTMVPGDNPYEALEAALLRVAVNPPPSLLGQLRDGKRGVLRGVRRCLRSDDHRLLIVIDQFEEVFTTASVDDTNAFLDALAVAVEDPTSPLKLVITLRADFYHRPLEHPEFARLMKDTVVEVIPLAGDEMERAIVEPARRLGVEFEPGLAARIAAQAVGVPSPLPLLQYTLSELFDLRDGNRLTTEKYDQIGGLTGALSARAEALYAEADQHQRSAMRQAFGRLTGAGGTTADLRRRVPIADLGQDSNTAWVLKRLGAARLITFDRDRSTRESTAEVAHEALLREWPRLADWLEEDLEVRQSAEAVATAAEAWEQGARDGSDLYRGGRLESALALTLAAPDRLRPVDRDFIEASGKAAEAEHMSEQRSVRRLRRLVTVVGIALVIAIGAGVVALNQRNNAEAAAVEAEVAVLISRSAEAADPKVGILLALEAQRRAPGPEADRALLASLNRSSGSRTIASFPPLAEGSCAPGWPGWVSRDGLTQSSLVSGVMVTRDLDSGTVTEHGRMPGDDCGHWFGDASTGRRYARSSDRLWLGPFDGPWDVEVGLDDSMTLGGPLLFGPDRLVVRSDTSVSILSSITGEEIGAPNTELIDPLVALSADGNRVAVASRDAAGGAASALLILDAADGAELTRSRIPGQVLDLLFDSEAAQLLASTSESRLHTIDITTGEVVASVAFEGDESYNLGVRRDGLVVVISTGSPGRIELLDRQVGPLRAETLELSNLQGGLLRTDEKVLTWDRTFQVDVLDLDAQVLVEQSLEYDALAGNFGSGTTVEFGSGIAVLVDSESLLSELIDLSTGVRSPLALRTADGEILPSVSGLIPLPGGFWQLSDEMQVTLWERGEVAAQLDLVAGTEISLDGWVSDGPILAVGGRQANGTVEIHVLNLGDGEIRELLTIETSDVANVIPTPEGGLIIAGSDGVLRSYDPEGTLTDEFDTGSTEAGEAVYDGGHRIALVRPSAEGGNDETSIVDLESRTVRVLPNLGDVQRGGWAQDGAVLVTVDINGSVNLWDVDRDASAGTLWTGNGVGFGSPWYDEVTDSIWVAASDEIVQLPMDKNIWRERACQAAGRNLTQDEWDRLVPGGGRAQPACG